MLLPKFLLFALPLISYNLGAQVKNNGQPIQFPKSEQIKTENISYQLIEVANKTWGYDVYSGKKIMIHQTTIPGRGGNEGFKTRKDAESVVRMVVMKLKKGISPPSISQEELQQIGL